MEVEDEDEEEDDDDDVFDYLGVITFSESVTEFPGF
jgi:hypothetical protein